VILNTDQMLSLLQKACDRAGGQKAFAKKARVSKQHVYAVLSGAKRPGPSVLKALGLKVAPIAYRKAK
jgi:DNA-binding phage protein